jgi:hypothetical protein
METLYHCPNRTCCPQPFLQLSNSQLRQMMDFIVKTRKKESLMPNSVVKHSPENMKRWFEIHSFFAEPE